MSTAVIETTDLHFSFGRFPVLSGVNFTLNEGEAVCLTGENGCGKSTALKLLIGAYKPSQGSSLLFGSSATKGDQLSRVGYVPQATTTEKISFPITARELVAQGLTRELGVFTFTRKKQRDKAEKMLRSMGLSKIIDVPFSELSGGLQQRVLIARALITEPELLILDEPISGVDAESRVEFLTLIEKLRSERNLTVLIVTHDLEEIRRYVTIDRIHRIEEGQLIDA
ncbi:High-affinity zinc uptake system ATP-binding protein ZnuC [Corynebacterium ciconiae DSM 44920]|uniref:metal ABC transporter ATP-binding protein n=1 Tax=Corynebacterium ciconiae TaxID=227319 RepID=UPI000363B2AC|nr:ATP-binding cassette domain-containing protein [Corynebacterium ciconiae]WKD60731.1 High-affinity zinc uptake system ATP-binding protein ZnuC [Corynebacterium ciconiae DSM 44920]